MVKRIISALLVVSLTACSTVPQSVPSPNTSAQGVADEQRGGASNVDKDEKAGSDTETATRVLKWVAVGLMVVLFIALVAWSTSSRPINLEGCCGR
jgi:hypothetical protein